MRRRPEPILSAVALVVALCLGLAGCGGASSSPEATGASSPSAASTTDLGTLIAAEDAAVYAFGVIGAHVTGTTKLRALESLSAHQRLRDEWIALADTDGQEIPPAAIAYDLPIDVRNSETAMALSIEIETRMIALYESAGEIAVTALTKARTRLARSSTNN